MAPGRRTRGLRRGADLEVDERSVAALARAVLPIIVRMEQFGWVGHVLPLLQRRRIPLDVDGVVEPLVVSLVAAQAPREAALLARRAAADLGWRPDAVTASQLLFGLLRTAHWADARSLLESEGFRHVGRDAGDPRAGPDLDSARRALLGPGADAGDEGTGRHPRDRLARARNLPDTPSLRLARQFVEAVMPPPAA